MSAYRTVQMTSRERAAVDATEGDPPGGLNIDYINTSGLPDELVGPSVREVASQLTSWVKQSRAVRNKGSLFDRAAYASPDNPYDQMRIARTAVANDDIVSGAADVTEGLTFQGLKWESPEEDEADVFNQNAEDINLDEYVRSAYRDLFTYSQVVTATWWARKTYKVRGRNVVQEALVKVTDPETGMDSYEEPRDPETNRPLKPKRGTRRRKEYTVWAPQVIATLDPMKVVPIGNRLFGQDRLAWQASEEEMALWAGENEVALAGDPIMATLFLGIYSPSKAETARMVEWGVDPKRLLELNPAYVWRHTLTRASHEEFPEVRLKSVFKLLDLKQNLMEADRVNLIGAANYILLVKKGSKEDPAYPEEIQNLRDNMDIVAKLPVIVSDHRLEIEIITPKLDLTLQPEKYATLNKDILNRLLGALAPVSGGERSESMPGAGRGMARILESRRLMLKRSLEAKIAKRIVEHPLNAEAAGAGKGFEETPRMAFTPRNVQIDNDSQMIQAILSTRNSNDLSRESWLETIGFDQEVEAQRRANEEERFDPIFQTAVPFDSPANNPQATGATGGRPAGGGSSAQSPASKVKKRAASGQPSTGGS